mgnify:CR=1 FL=1
MKKLMKKIDIFCYKHPRFGIPNLMRYIVIATGIVWIFSMMDSTGTLKYWLMLNPEMILKGQVWRLVTFIFVPQNESFLILLFLYFYYWIGTTLENQWGIPKFSIFLLSGIILTVIFDFAVYFAVKDATVVGTISYIGVHYIYLSMFFSFATLFPDMQVLFMFFIPMKIKWLALLDAVYFVIDIVTLPFPADLLPVVAVLNYLVFFGGDIFDMLRRKSPKKQKAAVNFKREKARMNFEEREKKYNHKCAVCGRTDTEYPGLEFRYCSRRAGYHCFCQEHINNHIHFTE